MKILVLGNFGMLGSMVECYFKTLNYNVQTTRERFQSDQFKTLINNFDGDFIVNCIGSVPQKNTDFKVNFELPIWLDKNCNCKIIYPSSDCLNDKDLYSISKTVAQNYLLSESSKTKIIQCSIIGFERFSKKSLLEWFLNCSEKSVEGYTNAIWNGITTLEWSKICLNLIKDWDNYPKHLIPFTEQISKFDLLTLIKKTFKKEIQIVPVNKGINRTLTGNLKTKNIADQLIELNNFKEKFFHTD